MKLGLSLSGLLQHDGDADMVQRFADVLDLVRLGRERRPLELLLLRRAAEEVLVPPRAPQALALASMSCVTLLFTVSGVAPHETSS